MILTILLTILMLMLVVVPHEFGHLITAKLFKIKVNEFAVGMGPLVIQRELGGTDYSLRAIPLGGYCAMKAENESSPDDDAFINKPAWQRLIVLSAGAAMNIIVAVFFMIIIISINGVPTNTLDRVIKDSPAYTAGIRAGDEIISVNGLKTKNWGDTVKAIENNNSNTALNFKIKRNSSFKNLKLKPEKNKEGRFVVGIVSKPTHNFFVCSKYGAIATWNINNQMIKALRNMIRHGISGNDVTGPVGMVTIVDKTAHAGLVSYFYLVSLISINMAIINLLPFPALDGGRIVFVIIRRITGNVISDKMENYMHLTGFALLMLLFVIITWQDLLRIFGK